MAVDGQTVTVSVDWSYGGVVCTGPGTTKFASFDNRHWHNECFACSKCHVSLVGRGFLLDGPDIICTGCVSV